MSDLVAPAALDVARISFRYIEQTGLTRGTYNGAPLTTAYGGDRIGCSIDFTPCGGSSSTNRSRLRQMHAFMMRMQGKQNRIYATDNSYTREGSFPATELFTNSDFSSGTTGWSAISLSQISASDGVLRITATGAAAIGVSQNVTLTQYVPYVIRSLVMGGKGFSGLSIGPVAQDSAGVDFGINLSTSRGYLVASGVATASGAAAQRPVLCSSSTGMTAGDFFSTSFVSMSRCILVDGGGNSLQQSDNFTSQWLLAGFASVSANAIAAPDGAVTGDALVEGSATSAHYIHQTLTVSSGVQDVVAYGCFNGGGRPWGYLLMEENPGGTHAYAYANLGTGAVGTVAITGGVGWTNVRAAVVPLGNGWYEIQLVARKTSSSTSIQVRLGAATADNTPSYTGGGGGAAIRVWRGGALPGSLPTRGTQSTTTSVDPESQEGSALHVKGLPVSTSGLLLTGDWFEIDGQLKKVVDTLDSDAAGRGYLRFSPPLIRAVSNNTPIIVHRPMGRFIFAGEFPEWAIEPGVFSTASVDLEEAPLV